MISARSALSHFMAPVPTGTSRLFVPISPLGTRTIAEFSANPARRLFGRAKNGAFSTDQPSAAAAWWPSHHPTALAMPGLQSAPCWQTTAVGPAGPHTGRWRRFLAAGLEPSEPRRGHDTRESSSNADIAEHARTIGQLNGASWSEITCRASRSSSGGRPCVFAAGGVRRAKPASAEQRTQSPLGDRA